jgi:LacI family transcriptional regulator
MGPKPVSMSDVAAAAGVSLTTASRALGGVGRVSAATRSRVLETAERLQFQPDMIARSFVTGKSFIVGVLAENARGRFSMPLLVGATDAFGRDNIAAVTLDAEGTPSVLTDYLKRLRSRRIDGILVVGEDPNRATRVLSTEFSVPVVFAASSAAPETDHVVAPDNRGAGRAAAEHLLALGRRRLVHVTAGAGEPAVEAREAGFLAALADAGVAPAAETLFGRYRQDWGAQAAERLLAAGTAVDGVFAANDEIAVGLFAALHRRGVRVPDDVALVGYDNRHGGIGLATPPLTTFDPRLIEVGSRAAARLLALIGADHDPGVEYVAPRLIPGRSTVGPTLEPYDLL